MKKIKIVNIVGARPNFIKIAPLIKAMRKITKFKTILVHTGQHYDNLMSGVFFKDLRLPRPDIYLGVGSGTSSEQIGNIMIKLERVLIKESPDLVVVVGDVNSTLASAITSAKLGIRLAHVEAGLRSFDRTMPEELNRIVSDSLSDFLFTSCPEANFNLAKEGVPKSKIFFVGNVMIDSLLSFKDKASELGILSSSFGFESKSYALLTLHRPSNVDDPAALKNMLEVLRKISRVLPLIFPAHPRTQKNIELFKLKSYVSSSSLKLIDPVGYLEFLNLMLNAKFVLTDSGGIQEETTFLDIPCLTIRKNTERPITITRGTNTLTGIEPDKIIQEAKKILSGSYKKNKGIALWDGHTAERIVKILNEKL